MCLKEYWERADRCQQDEYQKFHSARCVAKVSVLPRWCKNYLMPFTGNNFVCIGDVLGAVYGWVQECMQVWRVLTQLHSELLFHLSGCTMLLENLGVFDFRGSAYASGWIHLCLGLDMTLRGPQTWYSYQVVLGCPSFWICIISSTFLWCCDVFSLLLWDLLLSLTIPTWRCCQCAF